MMSPICDGACGSGNEWTRMMIDSVILERMIVPVLLLYGLHRLLRFIGVEWDDGSHAIVVAPYLVYGGLFLCYQVGLTFLVGDATPMQGMSVL